MRWPTPTTTPPAILPLLPICLLALVVGDHAIGLVLAVLVAVGIVDEADVAWAGVAAFAIWDVLVLVLASLGLRWLVRRWVVRHAPA